MKEEENSVLEFDAWNPGLNSSIPKALEPLITLYQAGNTTVDYYRAKELSDFCGLSPDQLIVFSVERLIVHELLVRVTSDLSVPDGPNYEDLGINLRDMVASIYQSLSSKIDQMQTLYDNRVSVAREFIETEIADLFDTTKSEKQQKRTLLQQLFRINAASNKKRPSSIDEQKEFKALSRWKEALETEGDPSTRHCLTALCKIINTIVSRRGRVLNDPELLALLATNYASNKIGDELICELVGEHFQTLAENAGYRLLPFQLKPVVMNVKGASASGKSTIRPQQRQLADKLGIPWEDFALISPDYWRKYLLDYSSLGEHYKYAAMLTGQELEIVDKKLDRYMALKAKKGEIPHLLIDRFRFDSFNVESGHSKDSKLISRFGDRIFMFFMITPPAETVIRAWERGASTGRYKAVDDLLYHNVEAFTGIPALFFSWVKTTDKQVHFEFLDNDVPKGDLPKSIAFGWNNSMTILNMEAMRDIDRFRKVNVDAKNAEQVFKDNDTTEDLDFEFLKKCIRRIKEVRLADANTTQVYAGFESGSLVWLDKHYLEAPTTDKKVKRLLGLFPLQTSGQAAHDHRIDVGEEKKFTLGDWGTG